MKYLLLANLILMTGCGDDSQKEVPIALAPIPKSCKDSELLGFWVSSDHGNIEFTDDCMANRNGDKFSWETTNFFGSKSIVFTKDSIHEFCSYSIHIIGGFAGIPTSANLSFTCKDLVIYVLTTN